MKKTYKSLLLAAIVAPMMTSCIEETLPQSSTVTLDQAIAAPGSYDKFVDGLISNMCGLFTYNGSSHSVWDYGYPSFFLTRDVEGQDVVPVGTNNWYNSWYREQNYLSPGYAITQLPWTYYYGWIKDCNTVIKMAGCTDYAEAIKGREAGVGRAYCLRAMYYLDLARMYATTSYAKDSKALTTVKITETTTIPDAFDNERMTWEEATEFILKDLDCAEKYLTGYVRADKYTPDVSVVNGLRARVYLEMEDWANAEKYAKAALTGIYDNIMDDDTYTSRDYGFNTPNDAWMFALQFKITDPVIEENDGDSSWGSVMILENGFDCGYAANYGGPNVIDAHLYSTIPATDFRKKCFVDFALDGKGVTKAQAIEALAAYSNYPERVYAAGVDNASYGLGGLSLKFRNAPGKADVKYEAWCVSVPLMRVEEMRLIEIEAAGMQNEQKGKELLEKFAKSRDPKFVYGQHNEPYYDGGRNSAFRNEVWWQRRVELWGEGFATFDLKRLQKGIIRNYAGTNHLEGARWNIQQTPNWMVWCFVGTEANYNGGLTANPDPTIPDGDSDPFAW